MVLGLILGYCINERPYNKCYGTKGDTCYLDSRSFDGYRSMHDAMSGMTGRLAGKTGDALDETFLDDMIVHHEGAVRMAEQLLAETKRPELIKLGNDVITAQTSEIEMMKGWRKEWFNK